jgi:hypothetical protein
MPDDDPAHQPEAEYVEVQATTWADAGLPNTFPSGETLKADRRDARAAHVAGAPATSDEEVDVERRSADPAVAEAYRAATQRGVDQEGEGRL